MNRKKKYIIGVSLILIVSGFVWYLVIQRNYHKEIAYSGIEMKISSKQRSYQYNESFTVSLKIKNTSFFPKKYNAVTVERTSKFLNYSDDEFYVGEVIGKNHNYYSNPPSVIQKVSPSNVRYLMPGQSIKLKVKFIPKQTPDREKDTIDIRATFEDLLIYFPISVATK